MASALALRQQFTAYGDTLERVEWFKYLGRQLTMEDTDARTIRANLKKARRAWARVHRVLRGENASPRVCGLFYKATVQAVLLFGSETWNVTSVALKELEGFHIRAAYRMARENRPRREPDGSWSYPSSGDVLEEVGLHTVEEYIQVRRQTIAAYIVNRPIFEACVDGERRQGSSPRQWWWEQPMDLDLARATAAGAVVAGDDESVGS